MPRESFDRQLQKIRDEVLLLGSMVEQAMQKAISALKSRDINMASELRDDDLLINEKRYAIENAVLILIATQQPIGHDLRMLAAILEVTTELERMGDYAKGIAKVVILLADRPFPVPMREITKMATLGVGMLHRALTAFMDCDVHLARAIPQDDDQVDALYNHVYHAVISSAISNPQLIDQANLLIWVAHNLERMADRVTNICERTVFTATGELLEMDSTDDEQEALES